MGEVLGFLGIISFQGIFLVMFYLPELIFQLTKLFLSYLTYAQVDGTILGLMKLSVKL